MVGGIGIVNLLFFLNYTVFLFFIKFERKFKFVTNNENILIKDDKSVKAFTEGLVTGKYIIEFHPV